MTSRRVYSTTVFLLAFAALLWSSGGSLNKDFQKRWSERQDRLFDPLKLKPRPDGASIAFDCKARHAAYKYATVLQPWRGPALRKVWDALELTTQCGLKWEGTKPAKVPTYIPSKGQGNTFYVDTYKGSNSNPGTIKLPFKTIEFAVLEARLRTGPNTIILRAGTFYLPRTLQLNSQDNGLTITNYPGETVYISGGVPLNNLRWKPYNVSSTLTVMVYENQNNVYEQVSPKGNTINIRYLGSYDDTVSCQNACLKFRAPGGITCKSFTFHTPQLGGPYASQCFGILDETWGPVAETNINSGRLVQPNIYVADVSSFNLEEILGLHWPNGAGRATRARYPDGNTETVRFPRGWILQSKGYLPARKFPPPTTVIVNDPVRTDIVMFQQYSMGVGGPCSIFTPPESYWCSSQNAGGASGLFETPSGVTYFDNTFVGTDPSRWTNPEKGVVHMWHPYHWAMWMYQIDSFSPFTQTIGWTYGGFQGARGSISGAGRGGEWYVENILELLDSPNEFFYDEANKLLYYFYNGTTAPPADFQLVATNLKTLIEVQGSQYYPVKNITLFGLNFITTAYTYLDPHGVPSGGDWAMQRSAALFFEGTEGLTVDSCNFTRLDGNALILSGYHRDAQIVRSEFSWIGDSVLVAWGYTQGIDGTDGNQPRGTKVLDNMFYEMGMFEKQSSPWFQAKSCQTLIKGNIMFNGPRALINFNDGFGGGNEITQNLLFNPNRESSDQGPFNSWDRLPFLTEVRNGTPSLTPAYNNIHHNFFLCNYGSNMCVDNDDGSSYYNIYKNFEVYGGHKSDFGGHNKFTHDSVVAMAQDYQSGLCGDFGRVVPGFVDAYYNNTCVQAAVVPYLTLEVCDLNDPSAKTLPIVHSNKVYNVAGAVQVTCGSSTVSLTEWQSKGFDANSKAFPMPSDDQIIQWGNAVLWD